MLLAQGNMSFAFIILTFCENIVVLTPIIRQYFRMQLKKPPINFKGTYSRFAIRLEYPGHTWNTVSESSVLGEIG